jgi:hypothetical protein
MAMGRPRTYNREEIAQDLEEWGALDTSINLNSFCVYHDPPFPPEKLSVWAKEDPQFRQALDIAKGMVACRREKWLNEKKLHVKAYDLAQYAYDYFLRQDRNDFAAYTAALKLEEQKQVSSDDKTRFDAFIETFRALQKKD